MIHFIKVFFVHKGEIVKIWAALFSFALALPGGVLFLLGEPQQPEVSVPAAKPATLSIIYRIDPGQSKFLVRAHRGGLFWFKGHDHLIAVRDFGGEAELTPDALNASLRMSIRSSSLEETSEVFTPQQKAIIKKELDEIVLESAKYPEIIFQSTDVKGELKKGAFNLKIGGNITLHGVTKHIVIPATVTLQGDTMHAVGKFDLNRSEFNVKATSAFHGMVRVKSKLTFTFDIIGSKI